MSLPLMAKVWQGQRELQTDWRFQNGVLDKSSGTLTLTFTNTMPRLDLRSHWRARPGHGPIEHWITIENLSGERVTVSQQESLALPDLRPGEAASFWWIKRGGSNASTEGGTFTEPLAAGRDLELASNCDDGSSPVPWMAVQIGETRGLYVGWEFSGLGRIHARVNDHADALAVAIGNHEDFKTDVESGETFHVPPAFVGCYTGDIDAGSYCLHRFILEKLRPSVPKDYPDPTLAYNLYLDAGGANAKEADVLRSARFCHTLGFETFMPDAMWFPAVGDWRWDPARFPHGIAPIEEYVHHSGMKLALWCAWTNGGLSDDPNALSVRGPVGHPDWFSGDFAPDWQPGPFYGGQICLGSPEAEAWAIAKTQWLAANYKLDYIKHDIGPIVNHCNKSTHRHRYGVDASYWATTGYYQVQEQLRQAFPKLLLENCSGGGHIKDFGIVQRTHYTVATDTLSNLPDRQSLYDSTFALPPVVLQAYTYERAYGVPGDDPGSFLWRSGMMGAWQIDPTNTRVWTTEERDSARRAVQSYKEWIRPILQDVQVHHILPRPDGVHWDGMFYWNPRLAHGTLYIFRPGAKEDRQTVKLKGLDPQRMYWVWCEDGSLTAGTRAGQELMQAGLRLQLPQPYTSDLIYVQETSQGRPAGLMEPGGFHLKTAEAHSDPFITTTELAWEPSAHARSYRVVIAAESNLRTPLVQAQVMDPSATLQSLPPGRRLYWKVEAISWGGRRGNAGAPGTFTTPALKELPGVTFVSDMSWVKATAGAGNTVHRDTNYSGKTIFIAGKRYPKGVWTHSFNDATPAELVIDIAGKNFAEFAADVGVEDSSGGGSVQFQVFVDGKLRAETPVLRPGKMQPLRIPVTGAQEVTLRVLNGGDGYSSDHAAWGFARFLAVGAKDPLG
jgi:alpha-galactosidase